MNPDRWKRVDALLSAALEREQPQRAAFLAQACEGDEELRSQVQELLAAHDAASSFMEAPPADAAATIAANPPWLHSTKTAASDASLERTMPTQAEQAGSERAWALGRYIVLNKLGGGGMGVVYAAYDPQLDRKVAVKLLRPEAVEELQAQGARERLLREAQAMARLSHPNVIAVHDVGTLDAQVFIAMEFLDGQTLTRWLKEKPREAREILDVFVRAGKGLAAAHAAGLVHRDFKPDNVIVTSAGEVKVLDFGLARAAEDLAAGAPTLPAQLQARGASTPRALDAKLTKTGAFLGTPAYMAPEQLLGKATDARTDQFSFCVALYEALYGERPFHADSVEALTEQIAAGKIQEQEKAGRVPARARKILLRGLRPNPEERYPSMEPLLQELGKAPRLTPRRVLTVTAMALAVGVFGIAYRQSVYRQSQVCRGAERKLAGVWDEARKRDVSAALMATGKPYATDTVHSVERALDAYAHDWVAMHTDACEATRLRGEQSEEVLDLRMECLTDRRQELQSLVDILARRDPTVVEKAAQAPGGLTSLSGCANIAALRAPVRPPGDPATRAKVEELRGKLAQASALEAAAKYKEALPIANTAVAEATQLRYRPIEAEARQRLASLQARVGDFKNADQTLREAALAAVAGRHDEALARSWADLVGVARELAQYERGHEAARYASALLERLGGVDEIRGRLFNNLAALLVREGKYAEALEYNQRALELLERSLGPEHVDVAASLNNAAVELKELGQYDRAIENYQRALAIREKLSGPDHPNVVGPLLNLGGVLSAQGKNEPALAYSLRALSVSEKAFGPQHPWVATALSNVGSIFFNEGKYDQALAYQQRALPIAQKAFGPEHPEVARILTCVGAALVGEEDFPAAVEQFRRALAIREKLPGGAENPENAAILMNIGLALSEQPKKGNFQIAIDYLRRALAIREKALGPENPDVASVLVALGNVIHRKEPNRALEYLQRALDIREKKLPANSPLIAMVITEFGRVYLYLRQPLEAKHWLEKSSKMLESTGSEPFMLAKAHFLLARALWDSRADRQRAIDLAQQAHASMVNAGRIKNKTFREVDAWLSPRLKMQASAPRAF